MTEMLRYLLLLPIAACLGVAVLSEDIKVRITGIFLAVIMESARDRIMMLHLASIARRVSK
ncbi:MAG: hypothetical protein QXP42_04255 [Candidatus Micrarchaeia archaeon]